MVFLLSPLTVLDAQNFVNNFKQPVPLGEPNEDYTILVPIFGDPKYFQNRDHLLPLKERVIVCINTSNDTMKQFAEQCRQDGFGVFEYDGQIKSPWQFYKVALDDQLTLLTRALPLVTTKYTVFLDGDSYFQGEPAKAIGAMERDNIDLASVRVLPKQRQTLAEKMQGVEYDCAMFGRLSRPWLTSGACIFAKTRVIGAVMESHSQFFYGGDVEIGRRAYLAGYKVKHLDLTVLTDVPETFAKLFRQRRGWWAGAFRTTIINIESAIRTPVWFLYYFGIVWLLLPVKWFELFRHWEALPAIFLAYVAMTIVANWRVKSVWMLFFPFYALLQVIVMPPLGIVRYFQYARETRNWGRYAKRLVYDPLIEPVRLAASAVHRRPLQPARQQ